MKRSWIAAALAVGAIASPARSQNLLANPDFDAAQQLAGWVETGTWSSDDFAGDPSSGSVRVGTNSPVATTVLLRQCVGAAAGAAFDFSAEVRVDSGQSAGSARLAVAFWDTPDCSGTESDAVGYFQSPAAPTIGDWSPVTSSSVVAPALTQSAEMELVVSKGVAGGSLAASFDHVFLPEPDAALAPIAALAALCALGRWRLAQG
jgi:hypothetical protein